MSLVPPLKLEGYAIYQPSTGLWSKGGTDRGLKKKPKIWSNIGHLKNHLNLGITFAYRQPPCFLITNKYDRCVVIDVTTGQPLGDDWINEYYFDFIRRTKAERKHYAGYQVKFEGTTEWLTNC